LSFSKRLGWVGVDVGTHAVKLAQVVRTPLGVRLHRAAVIQRTSALRGDDALACDQPCSSQSEIRAALLCGGFSGRNAICTPPMNVCQLRGMNVPPGTEQERRTMIANELTEEWAERGGGMEFDFWELESVKADRNTDVFNVQVLATSRPWALQLARDCRQAGLNCWALDGAPLAMARAVGLVGGLSGGRRVLAVDWGFSNTTMCVVGDDRPLYSRRIHNCAFGQALESITEALGVTLDEAQHLVDTQGLMVRDAVEPGGDVPTQAAITNAAKDTIEELVRQINRTLHFMDTQRRYLHPSAIWLLGGGASLVNIAPYLAQCLPLPVQLWQMPAETEQIACAAGQRSAVFSGAAALSALAWEAA
jgi:Tfp pilus assembly PilM family ATPase